jgi:hypothetical protein
MAGSNTTPLTFEIYRGSDLISSVDRSEESITIGSGQDALLTVAGEGIGPLHMVINRSDDGAVHLLDLGIPGGTKVNGTAIQSNTSLNAGDAVEIGDLRIVVRFGESADPFADDVATVVGVDGDFPEDTDINEPTAGDPTPMAATASPSGFERREAVLDVILKQNTRPPHPTEKNRPKVLEVNQIWSDTLLDTRHYALGGDPVTVGPSMGYRWNVLGVDMGWVPGPLRFLARYAPPFLSDIETEWRQDFYAPEERLPDGNSHKLFVWENDKYVARIGKDWGGFVDIGETRKPIASLVASGDAKIEGDVMVIPMDENRRLVVDVEGITFFAHTVTGARRTERGSDVDYLFVALLSFMAFLGGAFVLYVSLLPEGIYTTASEPPDRFAELLLEQPPEEKPENKRPDNNPDAGEGEKAKKEEGKTGKKESKVEQAKGNKVETQQQEMDREVAENAGILGALSSDPGMAGFGAPGLNANMTGGIGGLIGAKGSQFGSGGLGSRGSGLGGGGSAEGLGGLGTKGAGSGASGYGSGGGNLGERGEGAIGTFGGDPIILGALDRSLIDEVIKRHMNQIRYCYQRELTRDPSLAGKVVIRFTIAGDGSVSQASVKETTMGNSAVEGCITGRFMRMQFPEPRGGGVVIVSYPFLFSPG